MPGRKIAMRLMENPWRRSKTHARRAKGIEKKAEELVKLCGVGVAVVVAEGAAGAVPRVWESEEGVLDKYRALPPEIRAQHTLRNHLKEEICKDRAKLARVRQQGPIALADAPLDGITPAEAWELLQTIEASLSATARRLEALGLPAGGGQLEQIEADIVMPQIGHDGSNEGDIGFQIETAPCPGKRGNVGQQLEEFPRDDRLHMHNIDMPQPGFGFQCTNGNYSGVYSGFVDSYGEMQTPGYGYPGVNYLVKCGQMQAPGYICPGGNYSGAVDSYGHMQASGYDYPGGNYSGAVQNYGQMQASGYSATGGNYSDNYGQMQDPDYIYPGGNNSGDIDIYRQMQAPGYDYPGDNYSGAVQNYGQMQDPVYACPDLTMCDGVLPIRYYYPSLGMSVGGQFIKDTTALASEQSSIVASATPPVHTMDSNSMNLESYNGYGRSLQDFQHANAGTSTSTSTSQVLPQYLAPGTSNSNKFFHFL